ncbi:MAG: T9SS type A sorting domain-containing protein [Carboxylicivirga sp.]|jgi:hypothetical protein|nr:T9SS type A sorting domain-containing protein [Carboxylicivirga sp.]
MKLKELFLVLILTLSTNVFSQLTLDGSLTEGYYRYGFLPEQGHVIYNMDSDWSTGTYKIYIYNLSFSLIKEIDLSSLGESQFPFFNQVESEKDIIISQYLFNQDSKIEFILELNNVYKVYNEELSLIQTFPIGYQERVTSISLHNLSNDENNPNYKLKLSSEEESYFYNIVGNPFETREPTNTPQLKSDSDSFIVVSDSSGDMFTAEFTDYTIGHLYVTNIEGKAIEQHVLNGTQKEIKINLQMEPNGIYLISLITKDQNKNTIKIVK